MPPLCHLYLLHADKEYFGGAENILNPIFIHFWRENWTESEQLWVLLNMDVMDIGLYY